MTDPLARMFEWPTSSAHEYGRPNPESEPEACGLALLATLGGYESHDFDTIHLWRDLATGKFFCGHDSGCSCPTPFEDFHALSDMTEVADANAVREFVKAAAREGDTWSADDRDAFLAEAERHMAPA